MKNCLIIDSPIHLFNYEFFNKIYNFTIFIKQSNFYVYIKFKQVILIQRFGKAI